MALSQKTIYQQVRHTIYSLEEELEQNNIISDEVQRVKKVYFTKGSPKQKSQFAVAQYKKNNPFDAKLISFYNRNIADKYSNFGDPVFEDSGCVTIVVSFLRNHFKEEVITEEHFPRLKEDIKQSLVKEQICSFLEERLELIVPEENIVAAPQTNSRKLGEKRKYTAKQQALALYFLMHEVLNVLDNDKTDFARLLHLFASKSMPENEKGAAVIKNSEFYKEYLAVSKSNAMHRVEDLEFVKLHFEKFKEETVFKKLLAKGGELNQQLVRAQERKANKNRSQ